MSFYNKFIGITELSKEARSLIRSYSLVVGFFSFTFALSGSFMILYIIDALGFADAAMISAIILATQLVIDYPTGSLSDKIGQRWVLMMATVTAVITFYFLSIATVFNDFVIVALLFGFTQAQASGTVQSWFDNNYQKLDVDDPDRKNYGFSMTRINTMNFFISGLTFIVGGVLATLLSRAAVFQIQAGFVLLLTILVYVVMRDLPDRTDTTQPTVKENYMSYFLGGIKFIFSTKQVFFFVLAIAVYQALWSIWGNLILFPFYFGYSGSDGVAGILRSTIFFIGVVIQIKIAGWTKKVNTPSLPRFTLLQNGLLFIGGAVIITLLPQTDTFNLLGLALIVVLMTVAVSAIQPFTEALFMRMVIDLVPSSNRNAVYSLVPTISAFFAIPLLPVTGGLIEDFGLRAGFYMVLGIALAAVVLFKVSFGFAPKEEVVTQPVPPVVAVAGH